MQFRGIGSDSLPVSLWFRSPARAYKNLKSKLQFRFLIDGQEGWDDLALQEGRI